MIIPLGAWVVVFARLTLGLRMLGPFRPILFAWGFQGTGIPVGIAFTAAIFALILYVRPKLQGGMMPYYGRLSALLACVVLAEIAVLIAGAHLDSASLLRTASFPMIVLCLAAEGFARALQRDGRRFALWSASVTVIVAGTIVALDAWLDITSTTFRHPELVLVELAAILVTSTFLSFRWLDGWNPIPRSERIARRDRDPGAPSTTSDRERSRDTEERDTEERTTEDRDTATS